MQYLTEEYNDEETLINLVKGESLTEAERRES